MGMMGASLALALRKFDGFGGRISGVVRSRASFDYVTEMGWCDSVYMAAQPEVDHVIRSLEPGTLFVVGLPVGSCVSYLSTLRGLPFLVTDMSSTRRAVQEAASGVRFVGSHPICGSEDTGPRAAKPGLFEKRLCIVTPAADSTDADLESVRSFWSDLGMDVMQMDASAHDLIWAYLSHGPHILSGMLAHWGFSSGVQDALARAPVPLTGGGFRDMVRIAGSNPEMWLDIIRTNGDQIKRVLIEFRGELDQLIQGFDKKSDDDWKNWISEARRKRNRLCGYPEER